ncbi:hypothetical protein GF371_01955 [Candidatus Woesearchaeota archaeon]|nr:hypothetical protein [Candidatus Woesearchaeota archaeon]
MTLGRLLLTLCAAGGAGLSAGQALAQEADPENYKEVLEEITRHMDSTQTNIDKIVRGDMKLHYTGDIEQVKRLYAVVEEFNERIERARKAGAYSLRMYQEKFEEFLEERVEGMQQKLDESETKARALEKEVRNLKDFIQTYRGANLVLLPPVIGNLITPEADKEYFGGIFNQWCGEFEGIRVYFTRHGVSPKRFLEVRKKVDGEIHVFYEDMLEFQFEKVIEGIGKAYAAQEEIYRKQVRNAYQLFMYDHFVKDGHDRFDGTFGDILDYLRETIGNPRIDVKKMLIKSMPGYQNYKDEDPVPIENPFKKK